MSRPGALLVLLPVVLAALACGDAASPPGTPVSTRDALTSCQQCHPAAVGHFRGHGMAASLGPLDHVPEGALTHPVSGVRYAFERDRDAVLFTATHPDGGRRVQLVVGRIGAGLFDVSYVGTELDRNGHPTGSLSFLPVETISGHGLALSPFELDERPVGLDQPVTAECLSCHTTTPVTSLPGAAPGPDGRRVWPGARLGADAFQHLAPLDCSACHGDLSRHAERVGAAEPGQDLPDDPAGLGLTFRLGELPAAAQRDVCARCHLQGDAHLELAPLPPSGPLVGADTGPLAARRPALVPAEPDEAFRFVGQIERLTLSACFQGSEAMTCTTCHEPHASVREQGLASFDARCLSCHSPPDTPCSRPPALRVEDVVDHPPRSVEGCVDCHVRRSQPFDLPHLVTADHHVRRRVTPATTAPMSFWAAPFGELAVHDDGRLADVLATPAGRRWADGLKALGYSRMRRPEDAAPLLAQFGEPGSDEARRPTAPPGLAPLETNPDFHHIRGLVLESMGDRTGAEAAYGDALALDEAHPEARLNRAHLRVARGEVPGAMEDAGVLVELYPAAAKPWNVRARGALQAGDVPAAASALAASGERWPSDPALWHELGRLCLRLGLLPQARESLGHAAALQPSRAGLDEDLRAARGPAP